MNLQPSSARRRVRRLPFVRRSRAVWVSRRVWRPRLVFWAGAIAVGLVSVLFAHLADASQHLFARLAGQGGAAGWAAGLLIPPVGFALSSYLALRYFPGSGGSGIPQAIAARHLEDERERALLLSPRVALGKFGLTLLGLLSGASIGREGPTVQIGASVMLAAGRVGGMAREKGLILAGSAAGISAAFNTPLAGIVFAIEEMGRSYEARTNGLVLSTVVLAGLASLSITGQYSYFGVSEAVVGTPADWGLVMVCGVAGGLLGALFSAAALGLGRRVRRWAATAPLRRAVLLAALCGAGVALLGALTGGATFGTGYEQARGALEGTPTTPFYFAAKLLAGILSMVSGIPGGIFAPSLSVGAGLGSTIGLLLNGDTALAAMLGMAGYFAGVVQAPMTAFVIILEMTGARSGVVPIMAASLAGYGTARLVSGQALYHAQARDFLADVLRRRRAAPEGAPGADDEAAASSSGRVHPPYR